MAPPRLRRRRQPAGHARAPPGPSPFGPGFPAELGARIVHESGNANVRLVCRDALELLRTQPVPMRCRGAPAAVATALAKFPRTHPCTRVGLTREEYKLVDNLDDLIEPLRGTQAWQQVAQLRSVSCSIFPNTMSRMSSLDLFQNLTTLELTLGDRRDESWAPALPRLTHLELNCQRLGALDLSGAPQLTKLFIVDTRLDHLTGLDQCTALEHLMLRSNQRDSCLDVAELDLRACVDLEKLEVTVGDRRPGMGDVTKVLLSSCTELYDLTLFTWLDTHAIEAHLPPSLELDSLVLNPRVLQHMPVPPASVDTLHLKTPSARENAAYAGDDLTGLSPDMAAALGTVRTLILDVDSLAPLHERHLHPGSLSVPRSPAFSSVTRVEVCCRHSRCFHHVDLRNCPSLRHIWLGVQRVNQVLAPLSLETCDRFYVCECTPFEGGLYWRHPRADA